MPCVLPEELPEAEVCSPTKVRYSMATRTATSMVRVLSGIQVCGSDYKKTEL